MVSSAYFFSFCRRWCCCKRGPSPVFINPSSQGIIGPDPRGNKELSKERTDLMEKALLSINSKEINCPDFHEEDSKSFFRLLTSLGTDINEAANLCQENLQLEDSEFSQTNAEVSYKVYKALENEEIENRLPRISRNAEVLECSSCMDATIAVVVDALVIILSMLSLTGIVGSELEVYVTQYLSDNTSLFNEVQKTIPALADAKSTHDKAKAFYKLAKVLYASGMLMKVVKKAISKMPWYKRAYTLAVATAIITLWFASDDAAMIAQLVIVLATSTKIFFDAKACKTACH